MDSRAYSISGYRQRGAILLMALVLLTILTLVGVSSSQNTILQERMAGHTLDRTVSFQAAEAGIRAAEAVLTASTRAETLFTSGTVVGFYDLSANEAPRWHTAADEPLNSNVWIVPTDPVVENTAEPVRFMIERQVPIEYSPDDCLQLPCAVLTDDIFRITSQGFGRTSITQSIIQSVVRF